MISDLPRFIFIVGAPRCGTTTIAAFLKQHPRICFPLVKEPHFFVQHDVTALDDQALREFTEREFLDRFYEHCPAERDIGVDGTVSYLYAPESLLPALRLWPDAKFIIAVRDPMTMLPSLHARLKYTGDETIKRFEDAWAAIAERAAGRRIPRSAMDPRWLRYEQAGRFGTFVEQFFDMFGRERCFVSVFDDLAADPRGQYQAICEFVGIEPSGEVALGARRESRGFRFGWLQRLLKRPPSFARNYLAGKQFRQRERKLDSELDEDGAINKIFSVRKRVLRWNRVPLKKRPVPVSIQEDIRERLSGEIRHLGQLIGRNLDHWLEIKPGRLG